MNKHDEIAILIAKRLAAKYRVTMHPEFGGWQIEARVRGLEGRWCAMATTITPMSERSSRTAAEIANLHADHIDHQLQKAAG